MLGLSELLMNRTLPLPGKPCPFGFRMAALESLPRDDKSMDLREGQRMMTNDIENLVIAVCYLVIPPILAACMGTRHALMKSFLRRQCQGWAAPWLLKSHGRLIQPLIKDISHFVLWKRSRNLLLIPFFQAWLFPGRNSHCFLFLGFFFFSCAVTCQTISDWKTQAGV